MIKIIISLLLIFGMFIVPAAYAAIFTNAESYLSVGKDWGTGKGKEACHPSVIDFLTEYDMETWGGYRYWIVTTTDALDYYQPENPYVYGSNDGTTWTQILQLDDYGTNMLETGSADPELGYDGTNIVAYWLREGGAGPGVVRATINSEHTRSSVTLVTNENSSSFVLVSPTVVRQDATHWHMWGIMPDDNNSGLAHQIYYRFSSDGISWGAQQLCTEDIIPDNYTGYTPWHIEARANPVVSGQVEMVVSSMVISASPVTDGEVLMHLSTTLSAPTTLTAPLAPNLLLAPSASGWDDFGLYRSSFVLRPSGSDLYMDLFYDGYTSPGDVDRIGFASILFPVGATASGSQIAISGGSPAAAGTASVTASGTLFAISNGSASAAGAGMSYTSGAGVNIISGSAASSGSGSAEALGSLISVSRGTALASASSAAGKKINIWVDGQWRQVTPKIKSYSNGQWQEVSIAW